MNKLLLEYFDDEALIWYDTKKLLSRSTSC